MPEDTADIVGPAGKKVVATINSGKIDEAALNPPGDAVVTIGADFRSVTVSPVPPGDSTIELVIEWKPGDDNADIGLGEGSDVGFELALAPDVLENDDTNGEIELFGTGGGH